MKTDFLKEFKALLEKYNASVECVDIGLDDYYDPDEDSEILITYQDKDTYIQASLTIS